MYKILSLASFDFPKSPFYSIDILEDKVPDVNYDMVIYDIETLIDFEDMRDDIKNEHVYRISMLSDEEDKLAFESFKTHAWILQDKIDLLPELVKTICQNRYLEAIAV